MRASVGRASHAHVNHLHADKGTSSPRLAAMPPPAAQCGPSAQLHGVARVRTGPCMRACKVCA